MNDQELAKLRDGLPAIWWGLYSGSMSAGFTPQQSFALVQTFILATAGKGPTPPSPDSPPREDI